MRDPLDHDARVLRHFPELADGRAVPDGELGALRLAFVRALVAFNAALPEDAVLERREGRLELGTGLALYRWGKDDVGEFVEAWVHHRMTNARHIRVYETGRVVDVAKGPDPFVPKSFWRLYRETEAARDRD